MKQRLQRGYILVPALFMLALLGVVAYSINIDGVANLNLGKQQAAGQRAHYIAEAGLAHVAWLANQSGCARYKNLSDTSFQNGSYSATFDSESGSPVSITAVGSLPSGATRTVSRASVKVYDLSRSKSRKSQPGPDNKDTFIESEGGHTGHNKGDRQELKTSSLTGKEYRTLLQFELPALPLGAMVQKATLELNLKGSGSADVVKAHRLLRDWTESGATWEDYDGDNRWTRPGGDYDADVAASFLADGIGQKSMDLTALVQTWVSGAQANFGLILLSAPSPSGNENRYHSSDKGGKPQPRLTITYACECGVECGPPVAACEGNYAADEQVGFWDTGAVGTALNDITYVPGGVTIRGNTVPAGGGWALVEETNNDVTLTDLNGVLLDTFTITPTSATGFTAIHYIANSRYGPELLLANVDLSRSRTEYIIVGSDGAVAKSWSHSGQATGVAYFDSGSYEGNFLAVNSSSVGEIFDAAGVSVGTLALPPEVLQPGALVHLPRGNLVAIQDSGNDAVRIVELSGVLPNLTAAVRSSFDVKPFGISSFKQGMGLNLVNCNYALLSNASETVLVNRSPGAGRSLTLAAIEDSYINEDSSESNYGDRAQLLVGRSLGAGMRWRSLVKFDANEIAASLPTGTTVTTVTLRLYQESAVGADTVTMAVHRVTAGWAEGTITWKNSGNGGSHNVTAETSANVVLGTPGWTEWSLPVALITDWMNFPVNNDGLLINSNGGDSRRVDFVSHNHTDTTRHPQLVIEYSKP